MIGTKPDEHLEIDWFIEAFHNRKHLWACLSALLKEYGSSNSEISLKSIKIVLKHLNLF